MLARWLRSRVIMGAVVGCAAAIAVLPLLRSPLLDGIELKTLDARMRWRGTAPAAPEVAVVAIDARSVDVLGQWPWPRATLAELFRRIHDAGAKVIALDMVFSEPERGDGAGDAALAGAVRETNSVVLGYFFRPGDERARPLSGRPVLAQGDPRNIETSRIELAVTPPGGFPGVPTYAGVETNIDTLAGATPHKGHFVIRPDVDGTVRVYSLILKHRDEYYPALALRAVSVFENDAPISLRPYEGHLPMIRLGDLQVPASEKGELLVNFRGPYGATFPYIPAIDVLDGRVPAERLRGRLVFIGASETGIADLRTTPFDLAAPGVEVHATVADNLIHGRFVRATAVQTLQGLAALFLLATLASLLAIFARPVVGAAGTVTLLSVYGGLAQAALVFDNTHLPLVLPLTGGLLGYAGATVYRTLFVEAKARQIRRTFKQFVSAAVVEEMLRDPDRVRLGGERRELSVLFSDIRGFTTLSESMDPAQLVSLLNEYLTPMTQVILDSGGTLDKYMGDAIMAFFGAPVPQTDHAARACLAALGMRAGLAEMNAKWAARGLPPIEVGIGVNTGVMSVGNMGSDMIFDYTVIGDAANLGSRLEGLNKTYKTTILVSEFTAARLEGRFLLRELDSVRVKGKTEPVTVFELIGRDEDLAAWWASGGSARASAGASARAARGGSATPAVGAAPRMPSDDERAGPGSGGRGGSASGPSGDREARSFLEEYGRGLALFRAREFESAGAVFEACLVLRPHDHPSEIYLERTAKLLVSPPTLEWDGAVTMETK